MRNGVTRATRFPLSTAQWGVASNPFGTMVANTSVREALGRRYQD